MTKSSDIDALRREAVAELKRRYPNGMTRDDLLKEARQAYEEFKIFHNEGGGPSFEQLEALRKQIEKMETK